MKMPCEITVWNVLPMIRRELACIMVEEYKMSQVDVAKRFGLTEAAISQYMTKKRGSLDITEKEFKEQIKKSAKIVYEDDDPDKLAHEICFLCHMIQDSQGWAGICGQEGTKKN